MDEFILKINLGNDAMQTHGDLARALHALAKRIAAVHNDDDLLCGVIRDENGNHVGEWEIK